MNSPTCKEHTFDLATKESASLFHNLGLCGDMKIGVKAACTQAGMVKSLADLKLPSFRLDLYWMVTCIGLDGVWPPSRSPKAASAGWASSAGRIS